VIARLWTPARVEDVPRAIEQTLAGGVRTPPDRAHAWFAALQAEARQQLAGEVVSRAEVPAGAAGGVVQALEAGETWGPDAALAWLHDRDDLEGVAVLLRRAGLGAEVEGALADLDAAVRGLVAGWADLPMAHGDARLSEVSWMEPRAWWACGTC
jgi:hypothetical protein